MRILFIVQFLFLFSSCHALGGEGARFAQTEEAVKLATYGHIDAKGLQALMNAHIPFVLLDARGSNWKDATMIPGAKFASHNYSKVDLEKIIPNKNALIVVYCYSFTCPLSRNLADKLVAMGFNNVVEYAGGLKEWRDVAKFAVVPI